MNQTCRTSSPGSMRGSFLSGLLIAGIAAVLADPVITIHKNVLKLTSPFNPVKDAYWTNEFHHRRSVLAVSPNGKVGYYAYLDSTLKKVYVHGVDLQTFESKGTSVAVDGGEAGGLVVHDDGSFALLTTVKSYGSPVPPNNYPVAALLKFQGGNLLWKTYLNGPTVPSPMGVSICHSPQEVCLISSSILQHRTSMVM